MSSSISSDSYLEGLISTKLLWVAESSRANRGLPADPDNFFQFSVGEVHEWCAEYSDQLTTNSPSTILSLVAQKTIEYSLKDQNQKKRSKRKFIFWIGRRIWPTPYLLRDCKESESLNLYEQSIFLNPKSEKETFWAIETALSSQGTLVVIADCARLPFTVSRRFLLAAKKGLALGLIVKNLKSLNEPTASTSTWCVSPQPSSSLNPQWSLTLVRSKGVKTALNKWVLECRYEKSKVSMHLLPNLICESSTTEARYQKFG